MSFRVRIFLLVILVALSAIGATAWLTLNLTQREVSGALEAQSRHRAEIVQAVQRYGLRHGNWPGVNKLVTELSDRTHLHIQLQTKEGQVLVDSDTEAQRPVGAVQAVGYAIDPMPSLYDEEPSAFPAPAAYLAGAPTPRDLYGPTPVDALYGSPAALAVRQAAQYRTGLVLVRCLNKTLGAPAALGSDRAPYVTAQQRAASPACLQQATAKVLGDKAWFQSYWDYLENCTGSPRRLVGDPLGSKCIEGAYADTVVTSAAVPLQLYLGSRGTVDIADFGRPAIVGVAGLVIVAILGTFLIARQVSRPVRRLTGASQMLAAGMLDVRVRVKGESELARLAASFNTMAGALEQSEERQRRLIADVAHEMRTPLSNLRGYLEALSDGVVDPSPELFASLHEETLLQGRILDDLQVLALAEAGDLGYTKTPADLTELAATGVTAQQARAAEAGVTLTLEPSPPVWVEADQDRLRQVLGNLLSNAIRYTDKDGQVVVRVHEERGEAILTVRDTGVGIAAGDLPHVFERFWRADKARQRATGGTGLGLTIAQRIVTDHQGSIEVTSQPHLGTTFTVRLPTSVPDRRS
ncbi:sensor histidine kinase [Paractinoplanes atraurantiacus]|uniref:histidine kinase n=1 Tax=Paractinoplanes atraurantiacus TaxID=1036182 RepID=A0A285IHF2_9ACTN|nr:ATP-binding protein [Actinoplanes atraurantiacus]SNY47430.1 two-component system, OmpR family, sensor histidine kinase BaeS [Actinoplanes atraurantiacus]